MVTFHQHKILADKAEKEFRAARSAFLPLYRKIRENCDTPTSRHAVCIFFLTKDARKAISRISVEREITLDSATSVLISSLEKAFASTDAHPDLYKAGVMKVGKNFYIVHDDLVHGSPFDTARRRLKGNALRILDEAFIICVRPRKYREINIRPPLLEYIGAQLMDEGPEKDFRFDALSTSRGRTHATHQKHLTASAILLRRLAERMEIDPGSLKIAIREGVITDKNAIKNPVSSLLSGKTGPAKSEEQVARAVDLLMDRKTEREELLKLVRQNKVTRDEARIYFNLGATNKGVIPDMAEIAQHEGKTAGQIRDISGKVQRALLEARNAAP